LALILITDLTQELLVRVFQFKSVVKLLALLSLFSLQQQLDLSSAQTLLEGEVFWVHSYHLDFELLNCLV
jgi:hypothetical protein